MKSRRHAKILEIISQTHTVSQADLTQKLKENGFSVTQATVSRDIKDLGLIKVADPVYGYKYALPAAAVSPTAKHRTIFSQSVVRIDYALHTIVIKTLPGMAQAAGAAIDGAVSDRILGSIAGDDTILIVTKSEQNARELTAYLKKMQEGSVS